MSNKLRRKRYRSDSNIGQKKKSTINDLLFVKDCSESPNSREFFFIINENDKIRKFIKSKNDLEIELARYGFQRPYYIDEKGRVMLINNIDDFFHLTNINKIYNMEDYKK